MRKYGLDFLQLQDRLGLEALTAGETIFLNAQGKEISHTNGLISEQQLIQRIKATANGP